MQQSIDSCHIILSNIVFDNTTSDIQLMKIKEGTDSIIWKKSFGGSGIDCGLSMIKTSDNGFLIVGGTTSYGESNGDVYLVKTDYDGEYIWSSTIGDQYENCGTCVVETPGNGYLVSGYTKIGDTTDTQKIYLLRLNQYGDTLWTRNITNNSNAYATCIVKTIDGNYIVAGDEDTTGKGINKILVIKIDTLGNKLWHKLYGEDICGANTIILNADESIIISGYMNSIADAKTYSYVIKLNANGDTLWSKIYPNSGYIYNSLKTESNEYIFAGETDSSMGAFAIKTNEEGDTLTKLIVDNPNQFLDNGLLYILESDRNDLYFIGYSQTSWDTTSILLLKCDEMLSLVASFIFMVDSTQQLTQPLINPQYFNALQINYGSEINFQTYITNNENVLKAVLYWAPFGNYSSIDSFVLTKAGDTIYQQVIPGNKIHRQGVAYKIKAYCAYGVYSQYPSYGRYYIHPIVHNQLTDTVSYDQWKMISMPFDGYGRYMHNVISTNFGSYNIEKWRLYEHNNNINNYYVELNEINTGPIDYGRAYWLRQRVSDPAFITINNARTWGPAISSDTFMLTLNSGGTGWNDVGSPFLFSVPWAYVLSASGNDSEIVGPYYYNGTRWLYPNETPYLEPWKGYAIKNISTYNKILKIPVSLTYDKDLKIEELPNSGLVKIFTRNNGSEALNVLGAYTGASNGRDSYDYLCPPPSLNNLCAYFIHDDWVPYDIYGYDIRNSIGDGQMWDFVVKGHKGNTVIDIISGIKNNVYEKWLIDMTENVRIKIDGDQSYSFLALPEEKYREFKFIIGKDWYVKEVSDKLLPANTCLNKVYPNPSITGIVKIHYQLAVKTQVDIKIYNINGQLVKNLINKVQNPGFYTIVWDFKNNENMPISGGLYFIKMKTETKEDIKRILYFK